MQYKIQSIVFPTDEKHQQCRKLFYRGDHGILDRENKKLTLGFAQRADFVTYLNACSYQKWKRYTNIKNVTLHLDIEGEARILFLGYHKDALTVDRLEFSEKEFKGKKRRTIDFSFPDNDEQMIGFEITALSDCTIFGGYYSAEINEKQMRNVTLSLATTTCRKEEFIKKNVELIKDEIIASEDDIAKHFYLHVVDNGRTLSEADIHGKNVFLHPNINSGGSGGFARGMIESLHQTPEATHVLLMDDDVLMLPESIKRTYNLLRLLKDEYRDHFISGAMLYFEDPARQHEDIGTIVQGDNTCYYQPLKESFDHEKLENNLENERIAIKRKNSYAAWWYCCIPVHVIKKNGLPLPIFIRGDDCEYSLRCDADLISMNGICVWHMGFVTKYNGAFNQYQQYRNWLIAQATSGVFPEIDIYNALYGAFRIEMMRFNYGAAELIIRALEDYLKGPEFLKKADGEKITNSNFKLNDNLTPLNELEGGELFGFYDGYEEAPTTLKDRVIAKLTWNGQRLCPKWLERDDVATTSFDGFFRLHKIIMRKKILAINPYTMSGIYRIKDKKKFRELKKRFDQASKNYQKNREAIAKQYADAKPELTSEKFWRKYLGL